MLLAPQSRQNDRTSRPLQTSSAGHETAFNLRTFLRHETPCVDAHFPLVQSQRSSACHGSVNLDCFADVLSLCCLVHVLVVNPTVPVRCNLPPRRDLRGAHNHATVTTTKWR